jgi:hypothetical protein
LRNADFGLRIKNRRTQTRSIFLSSIRNPKSAFRNRNAATLFQEVAAFRFSPTSEQVTKKVRVADLPPMFPQSIDGNNQRPRISCSSTAQPAAAPFPLRAAACVK